MLTSVVFPAPLGTQQRENLAAANLQIDALESPEAGGVGFREIPYRNDWLHGKDDSLSEMRFGGISWSEANTVDGEARICDRRQNALNPRYDAQR